MEITPPSSSIEDGSTVAAEQDETPHMNGAAMFTTVSAVTYKPSVPPDFSMGCQEHRTLPLRGLLRQVATAGAADVVSVGLGMVFGYSAVALPQLQHRDSWITVDKEQASWIASMAALSMLAGCVASGAIMERWGRRATLQLQCVPSALGWALIASAQGVPALYAGRLLTGLGGGMVDAACQVYLSEISSPRVRGAISASNPLCFTFGVLLAYVLGCVRISWSMMAAVSGVFPVLGFLALCCVPESPVWLANQGRCAEARRAALWLHGLSEKDDIPLEESTCEVSTQVGMGEVLRSLMSRDTARPLCILLVFFFFQQFCGMNAVVFYAVAMFQSDESTLFDSNQSAVVIGLTRFVMTATTCVLLARVGRRPLALVSGLGMAAAMFALGTALYVQQAPSPAIALPCLAAFIAANTVGFFTVPWVMLGELLPEKCRGIASGLLSLIAYSFIFVVVKFYPLLLDEIGQPGVFCLFGFIAFLGFIFVLFFLPETHGKTLEEIETLFRKR